MFTGIVECIGRVVSLQRRGGILIMAVDVPLDISDSRIGDSYSISGACLTAVQLTKSSVNFEISKETMERTTLGSVRVGAKVNVERALRLSDRLGGHLVTGHIDTTGDVVKMTSFPETTRLRVRSGSKVSAYLVEKGSICIDGVSLTLGTCQEDAFSVDLIPHTLKNTTLQYLRVGDRVNLETDVIGKYVERFLAQRGLVAAGDSGISKDSLEKLGFL